MAMDSQPFRGHIPNGVPPNRTYQEVYAENGRWYGTFKKGKYMFPIDETELERLDVFHKVFLVARRDASHSAPLHNQETPRVLDLGCGTGIWGIDMADKYPGGIHVGLDLNYIQPEFIPANMRFLQKDIEDRWQDLEPGSWDLIHMRALYGSISNWPRVYAEIYR
jgi:SAM-dependent methyltransferase